MMIDGAKKSKSILFVGNLGNKCSAANGQSVKTQQVLSVLENSNLDIVKINTANRIEFLFNCWRLVFWRRIIIVPGITAIKATVFFLLLNRLFHLKAPHIVCVAVGGWLPKAYNKYLSVRIFSSLLEVVFAQSQRMKDDLGLLGINAKVMLNFRDIAINTDREFSTHKLKIIFISRVRLDKGIERSVQVINELRRKNIQAELDVYGPIDADDDNKINELLMFDGVQYQGCINAAEEVVKIMKQYDLLIFPTTYAGEGIPGVLVEALFAGLPVICTDWIDLGEVVDHGVTGYLLPVENFVAEASNLIASLDNHTLEELCVNCFRKASLYQPETAGKVLLESLGVLVDSDSQKAT